MELRAELIEGAVDAHACGVGGEIEAGGDGGVVSLFEEALDDGVAMGGGQGGEGFVDYGAHGIPIDVGFGGGRVHGSGVFALATTLLSAHKFGGGVAQAGEQPGVEGGVVAETGGFGDKIIEDQLHGVLGQMGVAAKLALSGGEQPTQVTLDEGRKSGLIVVGHETVQQFGVGLHCRQAPAGRWIAQNEADYFNEAEVRYACAAAADRRGWRKSRPV